MPFVEIFTDAWQLTRRGRWLWSLGLLLALAPLGSTAVRLWTLDGLVEAALAGNLANVDPLLLTETVSRWLLPAGGMAFVVVTAVWLLATVAEAGVIAGVLARSGERSWTAARAVQAGGQWLGRFIAIDAVVFLPWFVLVLALMLVVFLTVGGSALLTLQEASFEGILSVLGVGLVCLLPLFCLLPLLTWASLLLRLLAFREAVLANASVGLAIRQAWRRLRGRWLDLAILAALLWGIRYGFDFVLQLVELGVLALTAVLTLPLLETAVRITALLLLALPLALMQAWTAVVWTLAWQEITNN